MSKQETAIFAASCFWGVQYYLDQIPGVVETEAGYTGGHTENPDWHNTHEQDTGHAESVLVTFDPEKVSYETLVRHFFRLHDPTIPNGDGVNIGSNYRSAIFYKDAAQKRIAEQLRDELNQAQFNNNTITEISPAGKWWPAEAFHQKYAERTGRGICHMPYQPL